MFGKMNEDLGKEERLWGEDALVDARRKKEQEEDENTCIHPKMHSPALSNIFSVTTSISN